jgi:pimeloyl-ACP methyl ester carboxylesterase
MSIGTPAQADGPTIVSIRSGDVDLSVRVEGNGPLVIMMHGWPDLGDTFHHQVGPLVKAGYRVALPDLRGFGRSTGPAVIDAYTLDKAADDMDAIARALSAPRWVAVGHDWGSHVAWRSALRFPDSVAAIFSLSIPHSAATVLDETSIDPTEFNYVSYFQEVGVAERELERDPRHTLKQIFHAVSGDAPLGEWTKSRPATSGVLEGLEPPPSGPLSFMSDAELDSHAELYARSGFFSSLCWYRNAEANARDAAAYGDQIVRQPAGFLAGDKELALLIFPHALDLQRSSFCTDLRMERIVPGAGHWPHLEAPDEVSEALLTFLADVRERP